MTSTVSSKLCHTKIDYRFAGRRESQLPSKGLLNAIISHTTDLVVGKLSGDENSPTCFN